MPGFGDICLTCAVLGCFYLVLAISVVIFSKSRQNQRLIARPEPVTILKPLHGKEPRLAECLASFCEQDYPAAIQLVFGVQDSNDSALGVARDIKARFSDLSVDIKVDGTSHGANAKVSNLINMQAAATHDIIIAADSDILVKPDHIQQVAALLRKPGVGAVSVLYKGEAAVGLWSRLSAYCINAHFLPSVLVGMTLKLAKPCFGSTIALRRETLQAIGGFEAFANHLADDYAIGEAVRKAGLCVEIGSFAAVHICNEESARDVFYHQLRWARTVKSLDLSGYLGSFIAHPFAIASLGAAAGDGSCLVIAGVALSLRFALTKALQRRFEIEPQAAWLMPLADLMSFSVYIWSFFGSAVTWKSASFNVLRDGTLIENR
jgi:ceramide glucosyltransferase